jgi:hypothetical protein
LENRKKKYHTVGTVPTFKQKVDETEAKSDFSDVYKHAIQTKQNDAISMSYLIIKIHL